jgi:chitin disaccharide deacetylase
MLIVNADDFGASRNASDPVLELFEERVVSSASAMVGMPDSTRAASLAREREMPLGLHLNLTLPFADQAVPAPARERQRRLTESLGAESWREADRHRPDARLLADVIADQLERFRASFGEPTHIDGHHHVHVHPAVLDQLPSGLPIRPILSIPSRAEQRPGPRERDLHRRFLSPDFCFAFEHVHPALGGDGLDVLDRARRSSLEIMVHPQRADERNELMSASWRAALSRLNVGSYADLSRAGGQGQPAALAARVGVRARHLVVGATEVLRLGDRL